VNVSVDRDGEAYGLSAGLRVELVDPDVLGSAAGDWGVRDGQHVIRIASDLTRSARRAVLAHEIGHARCLERYVRAGRSGAYLALQNHAPSALEAMADADR
jgi:hypothetical protein